MSARLVSVQPLVIVHQASARLGSDPSGIEPAGVDRPVTDLVNDLLADPSPRAVDPARAGVRREDRREPPRAFRRR